MNLLFGIATSIAVFVYYELGRRQRLGEGREDTRRQYVDDELRKLTDEALGARERAAARTALVKALYALATLGALLLAVLLARHAH